MARGRLSALCKWSGLHCISWHCTVHHIWLWKAQIKSMCLYSSGFQSQCVFVRVWCVSGGYWSMFTWCSCSRWKMWAWECGGAVQQFKIRAVCAQLEILPVWVHRRLLHSTLPVSKTDDMHVGQIAISMKTSVLQHEMTQWNNVKDSVHHTNFEVIVYLCKYSSWGWDRYNGDIRAPLPNSFIISPCFLLLFPIHPSIGWTIWEEQCCYLEIGKTYI